MRIEIKSNSIADHTISQHSAAHHVVLEYSTRRDKGMTNEESRVNVTYLWLSIYLRMRYDFSFLALVQLQLHGPSGFS